MVVVYMYLDSYFVYKSRCYLRKDSAIDLNIEIDL